VPVKRIIYIVMYVFSLAFNMLKSSIEVAYASISGKIEPTIIEFETNLESEFAQMILANSITLTPGTLTAKIAPHEKKLSVAVITPRDVKDIIPFEKYIKGGFD
jgi:energy-converting hydrogenase B subunit A